MDFLEIALLLGGLALLVLGYRLNRRSWLVTAALLLFLSGNVGPFARDVAEGWASVDSTPSMAGGHR